MSARCSVALTLCVVFLSSVISPSFAQRQPTRRTAARTGEASSTATPRAGEAKKSRRQQSRGDSRTTVQQQDSPLVYTPVSPDTETHGVATYGEKGMQRATEEIMAAQAIADAGPPKPVRVGKGIKRKEKIDRTDLPQDPDAPAVASMPVVRAPVRERGGVAPKDEGSAAAPQTVSTPNFTAATLADTGAFPPDTMGAVGPTQFVTFLNGRVRTFNKTTGVADGVINADSDVFFASVMTPPPGGGLNFTSDPRVRYDRLTRRWVLIIIDVPSSSPSSIGDIPNRLLIAVSDAASNGVLSGSTVWTYFFVQQDTVGGIPSTGEFLDYPTLGIDEDALYVGGNMFGAVSGSFIGCSAFVIQKSSILGAGPVVTTAFRGVVVGTGEGPFTPQGVDNYATGTDEGYFIGVSNAAFSRLVLRRITSPGSMTPTISANILLTVSTTNFSSSVPHLGNTGGTNGQLDALDDRLYAAHIRNGRLWTAHNIRVSTAGVASTGAGNRHASRWYELNGIRSTDNGGVPVVVQSGTIFDNAATNPRHHWIPSVMVSGQGHSVFGFSVAGLADRINAGTNGRLRGDTLGTTGAVALYTASSTAYNPPSDPGPPRRWGDYSYISLDPKDDMTMWAIQQFCNATNTYGVQAVRLLAPPPATPSSSNPVSVAPGQSSVSVTITGTSVSGSEFYDPGADIMGAEPFNHISATVSGGVTVNSVTYNSPTSVTLDLNTTAATNGPKDVTVTNPDGQSTTGNTVFFVGPIPPSPVLVSEFRFRGPAGASDEFVELYNNTDSPITVADTNGGAGYGVAATNATGVNSLRCTVPNGAIIPARGHFLCTNSSANGYSLSAVATGNATYTTGIVDGGGVAVFSTTVAASWSNATRFDSVGFSGITGTTLFTEGTPLTPAGGITTGGEYSFVRKLTTASNGQAQDTNDNQNDFFFVSTNGAVFSTRQSILGAPGPENLASPVFKTNAAFPIALLDPAQSGSAIPNRVRTQFAACPPASSPTVTCDATKSAAGTMEIRRTFTNNTGAPVTRLRFRITDLTTLGNQTAGIADLRVLNNSGNFIVTITGGSMVTVQNLTLDAPSDAVTNGGGLNSTVSAGTITMGAPLANGGSISVNFMLGVQQTGNFRFFVNVEALP